jgi:hypothetical protein
METLCTENEKSKELLFGYSSSPVLDVRSPHIHALSVLVHSRTWSTLIILDVNIKKENILSTIVMTKVDCILFMDVGSLLLLVQCWCYCDPEPAPSRQLWSWLLPVLCSANIESIHHCMLFSLHHVQFVLQLNILWDSQLQVKMELHMIQYSVTTTLRAVIHFMRTISQHRCSKTSKDISVKNAGIQPISNEEEHI